MVMVPSRSGSSLAAASKQSRKGLRLSLMTLAITSLVRVSAPLALAASPAVPLLASASPSQASSPAELGALAPLLALAGARAGGGAASGLWAGGSLPPQPMRERDRN